MPAWAALTVANPFILGRNQFIALNPWAFGVALFNVFLWLLLFYLQNFFRIITAAILVLIPISMVISSAFANTLLFATVGLELFLFAFIGWLSLSGHDIHLFDYIRLVSNGIDPATDGDKNQVDFIADLFSSDNPVAGFVEKVLRQYSRLHDDVQKRRIIETFLDKRNKSSIRILLSDEELKGVFETALMYRETFSRSFMGIWEDESRLKCISITQSGCDIWFDGRLVMRFDTTWNRSMEKIMLASDTNWEDIRQGNKDYCLGDSDRILYLMYEYVGGTASYIRFSFDDSLSTRIFKCTSGMNVNITVMKNVDIDPFTGDKPKPLISQFDFYVFRRN